MPDDAEVGDAKDEGVDDAEDEDIMMMPRLVVWMMTISFCRPSWSH